MDFDASSAEPVAAVAEPAFDPSSAEPVAPQKDALQALPEADRKLLEELGINRGQGFEGARSDARAAGGSFAQKYVEPAARATMEPAVKIPDLPEIPDVPIPGVPFGTGTLRGVGQGVKSLTESLTAPIGAVLAPLAPASSVSPIAKTITKAAEVYFAGETAKAGGAEAANLVEKIKDPEATAADVAEAATKAVGALGFSGTLAAHAAPKFSDHPVTFEAQTPDGKTVQVETTAGKLAEMVNADKAAPKPEVAAPPVEPAFDPASAKPVAAEFQPETAKPIAPEESPAEPAPTPENPMADYARNQEIEAGFRKLNEAGKINTPEWFDLERKQIAIKNRNSSNPGMPPEPPPEPLPAGATATKNAQVDIEREARGLPPVVEPAKKELGVAWDQASKALDENPDAAKTLVSELKDKPRAVTDVENALLLHRQVELHNEFARVTERINDPTTDPAVKAENQVRFEKLSDDLLDLYNVGKQVGTETGRGLNARKTLANEDFSLANMVTERRAAKGGRELTPEEVTETTALHQKIAETQKAFDDYRRRASELLQREDTPAARKSAASSFVKSLSDRADAARERIKARLASGQITAGIDPGLLKDYAEVGAYHIAKGVEDFGRWSKVMLDEFKEAIQPHLKAIFDAAKQRHDELEAQDPRLKAFKTRTAKQTEKLQAKTAAEDFSKKAPPKPLALDEEALRLQSENERAKQSYQEALLKDRLANRTPLQKGQDTLVKWRRGFLLSGPATLAKLTAAAAQRLIITPVEEAVGGVYSKLLPAIAKRAPREGGLNIQAEAKAITDGLTKGVQDAWDLLKTGKSSLEVLFGKGRDGAIRESDVAPRSIIDFFGQIHGALKSPVKRAEFARSLEKRMAHAIANDIDVADPMVQTRLMVEAYKDASRSIFLQDNVVVDAYNRVITALSEPKKRLGGKPSAAGKAIATGLKIALPIVRVPTNIVAETIQVATGQVTGSIRLAGIMRRGVENLGPEEADLVLRELKKGTLGTAALLLGYFNAQNVGGYYQSGQKRGKNDVTFGSMKIWGHEVPSYLLHNPLLEAVQIGATVKRVQDSKLHKKDKETAGIGAATWAAAVGLIEEVPFVRTPIEFGKMLDTREGANARGRFVKGLVVPAAVDFAARKLDTDAKGNPIERKPKTLLEHIETGIPGLRQTVPIKR